MNVTARQNLTFRHYLEGMLRLVRLRNLLMVAITQYLTRILLIGPRQDWTTIVRDPVLFLIVLSTVVIAAAGYVINDYFDVKIDIVNKPERVVVGRYLKRRVAMGAHQVLNVLGVLLGLLVSRWVLLVNVLSVTLLWFYSAHFKRMPFIGNFVVSLLTALSLVVLTVYYPANRHLVLVYAVFSFFISLIREIIKDMEDLRGDEAHGCRTLPIVWGIRRTKGFLYLLVALFIGTLFLMAHSLGNLVLGWLFMALLLPIAWLVYRLVRADTRREFHALSGLCKLIMLLGLSTMLWA
jgi:4-hydroxybenzoate polyprenyltransferase